MSLHCEHVLTFRSNTTGTTCGEESADPSVSPGIYSDFGGVGVFHSLVFNVVLCYGFYC